MSHTISGCHAAVNASMSRRWKPSKAWRTASARTSDTRGLSCASMAGVDLDPGDRAGVGIVLVDDPDVEVDRLRVALIDAPLVVRGDDAVVVERMHLQVGDLK